MTKETTKAFPFLVTNRSINVTVDGESHTVSRPSKVADELLAALKEKDWDKVRTLCSPQELVKAKSGGQFRVQDGQVFLKLPSGQEWPVPGGLNTTIISYMEQGLDFGRLVKFALKLRENPSYRSVQQLFNFIANTNITIADDGDFIAYKSVRGDFKDCHTGTFDNSVGAVVEMPRNEVNEDPEQTCSAGLHVATYDYAHNHYRGEVTLFVAVNPRDVIAIPVDYNSAKMRVCRYKVLGISEGEFTSPTYDHQLSDSSRCEELEDDDWTEDDEQDALEMEAEEELEELEEEVPAPVLDDRSHPKVATFPCTVPWLKRG